MSKLYSRARTPPSPPPISSKKLPSSRHGSSMEYETPTKSYRTYDKYDDHHVGKDDRSSYNKSEKHDRYDKFEKSNYKSYSSKEYDQERFSSDLSKRSSKNDSSYREVSLPYKTKGSMFSDQGFSSKDSYLSKYPSSDNAGYSKYSSSPGKDKYTSRTASSDIAGTSDGGKRYSPYSSSKNSGNISYSKYGSDPYYHKDEGFDSYSSYSDIKSQSGRSKVGSGDRRGTERSMSGKSYSNSDLQSRSNSNYERYVIGDSVVYGSPGHYPKNIYPPSPNSKRCRSPPSPPSPPPLSTSKHHSRSSPYGKNFSSRYTPPSPKRYRNVSSKSPRRGTSPYSSSIKSPLRRPPSPPPPLTSYRPLSPDRYSGGTRQSRNYSPPLASERNKSARYNNRKRGVDGREGDRSHKNNEREYDGFKTATSFPRNSYSASYQGDRHNDRIRRPPRPIGTPQPLLSIPLTLNNVPKESRATIRETLEVGETTPPRRDRVGPGRNRRFEGRIGLASQIRNRKRPLSPRDRKKRRPGDLRLWIESRKSEGNKRGASPNRRGGVRGTVIKRLPREGMNTSNQRSRLMDSRKRILNKGKRKSGLLLKKGLKKGRRLPLKPRRREDGGTTRSHNDGGNRVSRDDGGSRVSRDDGGNRVSRDDGGNRASRDDGGNRVSRDDGGSRVSRDDGGSRVSRDDGGIRASRDDGGIRASRDDGGIRASRDDGVIRASRDDGGIRASRDDGGRNRSRENNENHRSKEKTVKKEERNVNKGDTRRPMNHNKEEVVKKKIKRNVGSKTTAVKSRSGDKEAPGSSANTHRVIRRPRIVSKANSLPLKPRHPKKAPRRSSQEEENPRKRENKQPQRKNRSKEKSWSKSRSLSRSRSRIRSRSHSRQRSP